MTISCGVFARLQAPRLERPSSDPVPLFQNGFVAAEVDVGGCDVVQALMVALVNVVVDEGFDPGFEIVGQNVIFQQDAGFLGLGAALDFAQRPGRLWETICTTIGSRLRMTRSAGNEESTSTPSPSRLKSSSTSSNRNARSPVVRQAIAKQSAETSQARRP